MKLKQPLSWIVLIIMLAACDTGSQRNPNREALQEEIRNREPKKLSEAQITAEAYRQGQEIADKAQKQLFQNLKEAIEKAGVQEAIQFCHIQALPLTDSAALPYQASLKRTSLQFRNPKNAPTELEEQLLEAYQYNAEQSLPMEPNVQRIGQQYLLYTQPIVIKSELCLQCHGEPQKDIAPQTLQVLDSLYPQDKARAYQLGDFRGIWSIKLSKKEIVKAL